MERGVGVRKERVGGGGQREGEEGRDVERGEMGGLEGERRKVCETGGKNAAGSHETHCQVGEGEEDP